jgi:hypothetical protein
MIPSATLMAVLLAGCASVAPPRLRVQRRGLPPTNRTGDGLLVAGACLTPGEYAFSTDRVTCPTCSPRSSIPR